MIFEIPNGEIIQIETIILDLNGTLSVYGKVAESTVKLIQELKKLDYKLYLISGDIRGDAKRVSDELGLTLYIAKTSDEKAKVVENLNPETCAAIGNARIDIGTFKKSKIAIATLQSEGIHTGIFPYVDIIVPSIDDALRLFIDKESLSGTLRT
ncbi:MAG TPA: hypothetical protein DDX39_06375 [Bacteroidales bacterium]|nr:MAG: hypothetical protein A2W98_00450 [Bacteroidetes bacterium GWF2_33_38]OFY90228.1 MAG: hypothetical protein A2236_02790 [Bacteroidetes bacterium RIFOXYA2_FULL_33_7]HBF88251.1 hypothetical protein [Bacteroidales bacterium]